MLGEVTVRMEETEPPANRVMVDGFRDATGPDGETVAATDRVPVRPLMPVSVMVELDAVPAGMDKVLGLADIVKSTTWTVTCT